MVYCENLRLLSRVFPTGLHRLSRGHELSLEIGLWTACPASRDRDRRGQ